MSDVLGSAWVGLMRHGKAWSAGMPAEERSEVHRDLTTDGVGSTGVVAQRFKELLDEMTCDPTRVVAYDVGTPQSIATAKIVPAELDPGKNPDRPPSLDGLAPQALATHTPRASRTCRRPGRTSPRRGSTKMSSST